MKRCMLLGRIWHRSYGVHEKPWLPQKVINCDSHFSNYHANDKVLSLLTEEDFKELGLAALGDRRLLSHLLKEFKKVIN